MKRIILLLLSLVLLLSLFGCSEAETPAQPTTTAPTVITQPPATQATEPEAETSSPILYRVTDEKGGVAYLLGSIHIGTEEMYPLPDYVLDAYESADALAVECDILEEETDMAEAVEMLMPMVLTDGTTISDYLEEDCYNRAVEILTENISYVPMLDMYKPVMWYMLISNMAVEKAGAKTDLGVDMYFLTDAHETGKTIYEIESAAEQYAVLGNLSMELQALMLESTVCYYDDPESHAYLREMCHAWAVGDAEGILDEGEEDMSAFTPEEIALLEEFNESLEGQRNVDMTEYAKEAMASGETVFIVVGAAHILGDDGMANALKEAGYTVMQVE